MAPAVSALIAVAVVGMLFSSTRLFGFAAMAILVSLYPPILVAITIALLVYLYLHQR
jgi:hypothetical protein